MYILFGLYRDLVIDSALASIERMMVRIFGRAAKLIARAGDLLRAYALLSPITVGLTGETYSLAVSLSAMSLVV